MATPYHGFGAAEGDETTASLAAALGLTDFPTLGSAPAGRGGDGEGVGRGGTAGASACVSTEQRPPPPPGMLTDDAAADVYRYRLDAAALAPHGGGVGSRPALASAASSAAVAGVLGVDGGDWTAGIYRATAAGAQPHGAAVGSGAVGGGGDRRGANLAVLTVADSDDDDDMDEPLALRLSSASAAAVGTAGAAGAAAAAGRRRRRSSAGTLTAASSSGSMLSGWGTPLEGGGVGSAAAKTLRAKAVRCGPLTGADGGGGGDGSGRGGQEVGDSLAMLRTATPGLTLAHRDATVLSSPMAAQLGVAIGSASRHVPPPAGASRAPPGGRGGGGRDGVMMTFASDGASRDVDAEADCGGEEDADEEMSGMCVDDGDAGGEESTSSRTLASLAAGTGEASASTATVAGVGGGGGDGGSEPKKKQVRARVGDLSPDMIHRCPFDGCSKKFAKKYNLKIHVRRHTGELPFACGLLTCGKRFMWHSSFLRHQRSHEKRTKGRPKDGLRAGGGGAASAGAAGDDVQLLSRTLPQLPTLGRAGGVPLAEMGVGQQLGAPALSPLATPNFSDGHHERGAAPSGAAERAAAANLFADLHGIDVLGGLGGGGAPTSDHEPGGGSVRMGGLAEVADYAPLHGLLGGTRTGGVESPASPALQPLLVSGGGHYAMPAASCMSPCQFTSSAVAGGGGHLFDAVAATSAATSGSGVGDGGSGRDGGGDHGGLSMPLLNFPAFSTGPQPRFDDLHAPTHLPAATTDHEVSSGRRLSGAPSCGPTMVSLLTDQPVNAPALVGQVHPPGVGAAASAATAAGRASVSAAAAASGASATATGHTGVDGPCFSPVSGTTALGGLRITASALLDEDSGCRGRGAAPGGVDRDKGQGICSGDRGRHVSGIGAVDCGGGGGGDGGGVGDASSPESAAVGDLATAFGDARGAYALSSPSAAKRTAWGEHLCQEDTFHGDFDAAFDFFTH